MSVTKVTLQNYAEEVSHSEKPVLIDFYADWCGPCKMTAPELEAFSQEYDDVKACKINVDESADLAAMYGIMSIPTMVLVKNGKEADRHVGGCEKADIRAFCDKNM
ncbi:MAG: thioredoxin [Ruminococcus sp.]|nr:thioredoxin [Ruminococcus sp.]